MEAGECNPRLTCQSTTQAPKKKKAVKKAKKAPARARVHFLAFPRRRVRVAHLCSPQAKKKAAPKKKSAPKKKPAAKKPAAKKAAPAAAAPKSKTKQAAAAAPAPAPAKKM